MSNTRTNPGPRRRLTDPAAKAEYGPPTEVLVRRIKAMSQGQQRQLLYALARQKPLLVSRAITESLAEDEPRDLSG
jgi:hypothetical protein